MTAMLDPPAARGPYGRADLQRLLAPRSVALVGASANPASLGGRTLANLASFPGPLYPVNERHAELAGRRCYPSVAALPEAPDLVVLAVPAAAVAGVAAQAAARGAGALVVLASGYAETGEAAGQAAQAALAELARTRGLRVVGPNCVGLASRPAGLHAAFAEFSPSVLAAGRRIGLVSQSGALGMGLSHAAEHGLSISHVLTCGNSCDVDVADCVAWLAEDPDCDAIALAFEGLADAGRLAQAARLAAQHGKPIAACKLGQSAAGRAAAAFHSACPTGTPADWQALCADGGIVPVTRIEALMDTAAFLAKAQRLHAAGAQTPLAADVPAPPAADVPAPPVPAPPVTVPGLAVLSGSGGTGILAVDAAERHGLATPQPAEATVACLRALLPPFGAPRNPCDLTAQVSRDPASLLGCAEALLADPCFGALLLPWGRAQPLALLASLDALAARYRKPLLLAWMSQRLDGPGLAAISALLHTALFRSLDDACAALAASGLRGALSTREMPGA